MKAWIGRIIKYFFEHCFLSKDVPTEYKVLCTWDPPIWENEIYLCVDITGWFYDYKIAVKII